MLAGVYRFKTINALDYSPIKMVEGDYSISSKETGKWLSDKHGEVYLDHLKVGLTNLLMQDDPDYFNMVINGARVLKGEESKNLENQGRTALLVPRSLDKELLLTLTWVGQEF